MATTSNTASTGKAFSIKKFSEAFENSPARQYMSDMDVTQIHQAIEEKDVMLLGKLYEVLLREQDSKEEAVRDFVISKNKIIDEFMVQTVDIDKKFVEAPRKKAVAKAEKKEQKSAENILKGL